MDAMRLVNPRLLQQAGSARGYLAGAARGTGLAVLSGVLAWLGGEVRAATAAQRTMLLITHDLDALDELDQVAGFLPPGVLLDFEELSAAPQEATPCCTVH